MAIGSSRRGPCVPACTTATARGPELCFWAVAALDADVNSTANHVTRTAKVRYKGLDGERGLMDVNEKAPDFTLPDQEGNPVSLKEFRGKTVVLFFYPKADTPG